MNKETSRRYYEVVAKCGHVGRRKYIPISFAICAHNGKEAAFKARATPRVKHHRKDAIMSVKEISYEEFLELRESNDQDEYLHAKCSQEVLDQESLFARVYSYEPEAISHKEETPFSRKYLEYKREFYRRGNRIKACYDE